jgi:hypothetical protein
MDAHPCCLMRGVTCNTLVKPGGAIFPELLSNPNDGSRISLGTTSFLSPESDREGVSPVTEIQARWSRCPQSPAPEVRLRRD